MLAEWINGCSSSSSSQAGQSSDGCLVWFDLMRAGNGVHEQRRSDGWHTRSFSSNLD